MFASKNFFLGSTAKPFSISYVGRVGVQVGGNTTSETYAGASIGTADPTRILVIVVTGANNAGAAGGTTSVTVDGNPMTAQVNLNSSRSPCSIWTLAYPTGTTATFVINHHSGTTGVELYAMYNTINGGTATNTASAYTASTQPVMTLTCPAGGAAIFGTSGTSNPTTTTIGTVNDSWTGAFGVTGASILYTPTPSGSVTNTVTSASSLSAYCCASFI